MSNIERALKRAQQAVHEVPSETAAPSRSVEPTIVAGTWTLHPLIVAVHNRYSPAAEAFRKLAVKLLAIQRSHGNRPFIIAVTSPERGEGKSLTAANLALVLAQDFRVNTLLVDCDLRRPTFPRYLGVNLGTGLADLVGGAPLEDCIVGTPMQELHLLGSGSSKNPTEVFETGRIQPTLDALRETASMIIFDCPPVLPVADTQLLAPNTDGLLMVVRAGDTQSPTLRRMLDALNGAPLIGFVLNYADAESPSYYYTDYYGPTEG